MACCLCRCGFEWFKSYTFWLQPGDWQKSYHLLLSATTRVLRLCACTKLGICLPFRTPFQEINTFTYIFSANSGIVFRKSITVLSTVPPPTSPSQKNDEEYEKSDKQDIIKAQVGWESSTNQPLEDRAYWVKSYTDYIESTGVYIGYNTDRKTL